VPRTARHLAHAYQHLAGTLGDGPHVPQMRLPLLGEEQAGRDDLQALEERRELSERVTVHPGRRTVHAEEPIRDLAIAAAYRDDDIAARGKQPGVASSQFRCRYGVEEMQDRAHDQAGWLAEINVAHQVRCTQHRVAVPHVGGHDHNAVLPVRDQGIQVGHDQRVKIDIGHCGA
jgi:hypothetical protein